MIEAQKGEDIKEVEKHAKRKVKVDETHVEDCKRLFSLMGIPFVTATSESEAYCALLCKRGVVNAVATEDMDALCFGTPILLRNLNASQAKKLDIEEYNLGKIMKELEMSMEEFVDLCILMGCDYCDTIKGVGYKRAYELIKRHGCIESLIENERLEAPENFDYRAARVVFSELSSVGEVENFEISYEKIDRVGLVEFLVKEKGFDEKRVMNGVDRMMKAKSKGGQMNLSSWVIN